MHLAELAIEVTQQNEEYHSEVTFFYFNSHAVGMDFRVQMAVIWILWETLFSNQLHNFHYHPQIHFHTHF